MYKLPDSYRTIGIKFHRDSNTGEIDYRIAPEICYGNTLLRKDRYLTEIGPDHVTEFIVPFSTEDDNTALERLKNHILRDIDKEIADLKRKRRSIIVALSAARLDDK